MSDTIALPQSPVVGPKPGDVIAGKYRLERELGRGAMGTVWAGLHTTLGQRVAIKLIAGEQSRSVEARQRFRVEAKAAARLRSRHVVQVYDDGETPDGTPYIVMEYLDGQTLEERLDAQRDMGLGEAVRIATHVGRALARAHAQGIVHRDLKSGNIFIAKSEDDELGWLAKVLDFGVAKVLTEVAGPFATKTGTIVGTPLFMSPEQVRGAAHVDHRADLYSLGIVFYNMVTGSHAFDGPSYSDVLVAICTEALPDIRVAAPWLPEPLRTWFDKACAREREARFQSADEMIEALQQAAGPASRLSRPSVPDEVSGPSGTLVGHAPPDVAATILAGNPGEPRSAPGSIRGVASERGARPPRELTATRVAPLSASLWLWAASGVGLALVTVSIVLAVMRFGGSRSVVEAGVGTHATAVRAAQPMPTPSPVEPVRVVAQNPAPARAAAPLSSPSAPQPSEPTAPSRVSSARRAPSTPRRISLANTGASAPTTAAPRAPATPDMGF